MAPLDHSTFGLLLLAGAIVGALLAVLPAWRELASGGATLPIWRFLRSHGVGRADMEEIVGERGLRQAELCCSACGSRQECVRRLGAGAAVPVRDCPNVKLFPRA